MRPGRVATAGMAVSIAVLLIASFLIVRLMHQQEQHDGSSFSSTSPGPLAPLPLSVPSLGFKGSGFEGGGVQNVVAADPSGSGVVLAGGDVSGFQRSTDWGIHWKTSNEGITTNSEMMVATIAFSEDVADKVYAGVGWKGQLGGLLVSTNGGMSWALRSDTVGFSGITNPRVPGLERPFLRSTGNLLALDEKDGLIYAATYDQGVMRSADDGKSWTSLGLKGKFLRSIVLDPSNPEVVYVAALGDGVYKTTAAKISGGFTRLAGGPPSPAQLAFIDGDLYVVAGRDGVWRTSDGGMAWTQLSLGSIPSNGIFWRSIAGYRACGKTFLYLGADTAGKYSVIRSTDGGTSWSAETADPSHISTRVGSSSADRWWLAGRPEWLLGGTASSIENIAVAMPQNQGGTCVGRVFLSGDSGVWESADGGVNWFPAVKGMGVTVARGVAVDPHIPGRVYVGVFDWTIVESTDGGETFVNNHPKGPPRAYCVGLDPSVTPGRVYVGIDLHPEDGRGEVFSSSDPTSASRWSSEGLRAATNGGTPVAIAAQEVDASPVLLVAVAGEGIWRKASGGWVQVNDHVMTGPHSTRGASFAWPQGSAMVYFFDPITGLWRSDDAGGSWTRIWDVSADASRGRRGFISSDPRDPSRLYVSIEGSGVYRLDDAASGSLGEGGTAPKKLGSFRQAGPLSVDRNGGIFVTEGAEGKGSSSLFFSGDLGATWHDIATADFRKAVFDPIGMAIGPDDRVYVALNGNGLLIGLPATP
jgi:hypothetical protein